MTIHQTCSFGEPKQKPCRKWTISQLAPIKQDKFLDRNPLPPPFNQHLKNIYLSIRSLTQGLFLSLSTTWKLIMGLSQGQRRSSATSLTAMVSSCVSSTFFPANCCLLLLLEGSHHWWNNSPSSLQHGMGLVQEKKKKLKTHPSIPPHLFQAFTTWPAHTLPSPSLPAVSFASFLCCLLPIWLFQVVEDVNL